MSGVADLQDRRREAVAKVEARMITMLVSSDDYGDLTVAEVKAIASAAKNAAWDALVECHP